MELVRKPESSRMRRKSVSKRKLIFQVPMVRIHFPPAVSPQTFGSSRAARTAGARDNRAPRVGKSNLVAAAGDHSAARRDPNLCFLLPMPPRPCCFGGFVAQV